MLTRRLRRRSNINPASGQCIVLAGIAQWLKRGAQFSLYVHKGGLKPNSFHFFKARSFNYVAACHNTVSNPASCGIVREIMFLHSQYRDIVSILKLAAGLYALRGMNEQAQ